MITFDHKTDGAGHRLGKLVAHLGELVVDELVLRVPERLLGLCATASRGYPAYGMRRALRRMLRKSERNLELVVDAGARRVRRGDRVLDVLDCAFPASRTADTEIGQRVQHGTAQHSALRQRYLEMMRAVWAKHTKPYDVMHSTEWSQFRKFALWSIIA